MEGNDEYSRAVNTRKARASIHQQAIRTMCAVLGVDDVYVDSHTKDSDHNYVYPDRAAAVDRYVTQKYIVPFYREVMPRIYKDLDRNIYVWSPMPSAFLFRWWVREWQIKPGRLLDNKWLATQLYTDLPPEMPYRGWWNEQFTSLVMQRGVAYNRVPVPPKPPREPPKDELFTQGAV